LEENGFTVEIHHTDNLAAVKTQNHVPPELQSCHTAIVDGYVIEGHVPVAEIKRLIADRPNLAGLAVPGMPAGSPGMEAAGYASQPFDVIGFDHTGAADVFASYR